MPDKCTKCGKIHPDDAPYLINGCDKCGGKFFFYVRPELLEEAEQEVSFLSRKDMKEIEEDIRDIVSGDGIKKDDTVVLDLEAIRVIRPGKYQIDVTNLFNQKPIVVRVGAGRYEIDLSTLMTKISKKK
ncbi:MAG: hypothetical protein KAT83_03725 [Candidatus Aenigmarchaeota archaeon]|nr:hypothetical protein [Candidatus Aenigmarchaeota archaeon]